MANSAAARVAAKPAFPPKEREGGREGGEGREGIHEHVWKGETVSMTT